LRELALQKGVKCRYSEFSLLLSDIRDGYSREVSTREWLEPLRSMDVLAIDELGKGGRNREFEQGILDEIVSVRYNAGKPTLFASNYPRSSATWRFGNSPERLDERVGPRIYSRLHELCDFVDVVGKDYREVQHDERAKTASAQQSPSQRASEAAPARPAGGRSS
jgi:DNA replication protein DnaC